MDGCYFCWSEKRRGQKSMSMHSNCEDHTGEWGENQKWSGTSKATKMLRESVLRSYKARVAFGEDPVQVKRDLAKELNVPKERIVTAIRLARVKR